MKILITGGAGFIGSHITDKLIKNKHKIVIIDNLSTGVEKNINPKAKFYYADLTNFKKISEIFKKEKPEIVFHLAAQIDVRKSVAKPVEDAGINILAGINLIDIAYKSKVKKFIFSSTGGAIYGETKFRPTKEDHPEWPLSPYGIGKLSIDKYLNYYNQVFGFNFISLRYSNVYGPRQNSKGEAGVVAIFIDKMIRKENPIINGNGKQTRDYIFVEDVAEANLAALKNYKVSGFFNIGTGIETDVNELFDEINKHFEGKFKKIHGQTKLGEQKTSCLSNSKAKKILKWKPKINFENGIEKTYKWFKMK